MPIGDPYAHPFDLEQRLGKTDDGTFSSVVEAASRAVESFARRQFNQADDASPRRFRPVDLRRLPVDDFHTTDDLVVEVGDVVLESDEYDPRPWDGVVDGQPGWPFFDLFAVGRRWPYRRRAAVTVTAKWGWAAVPAAIVEATLDVAVVMHLGAQGSGPVRSEAIDGYSVSYATPTLGDLPDHSAPPELRKAVPYRRRFAGGFGIA